MKKKQAVLTAIECVEKEIQRISFDAGLFEQFNAVHGKKYFLKREKLREAVAALREMIRENQIENERRKYSCTNHFTQEVLDETSGGDVPRCRKVTVIYHQSRNGV